MRLGKGLYLAAALALAPIAGHAEVVKVGAVYALTGPGAVGGGDGMRGTELAIEQINAAGGLKKHDGMKIELVKGDTQSKPVNAVGETERLITESKVVLVMGSATSNETLPLSQVAEKYTVPHINTIPQNEAMTNGKLKWTWSSALVDSDYVEGMMRALEMIHKVKPDLTRVAVLVPDNEYGIEMGKMLKAELSSRKDLTLTTFVEYGANAQELLQPALKLKASRPDIVLQVGYFRAGVQAAKAYEQLDFHPIVIGTGGMAGDPKLPAELGNLVDGLFAVTSFAADSPAARPVSEAYEKKFSQPLTVNSALGYFGTLVALKALDEAKSFSPQDIAAALRQLRMEPNEIIIAADYLEFDENGRNKGRDTVITQFQGNKPVTVWPAERAQAQPRIRKFNTPGN